MAWANLVTAPARHDQKSLIDYVTPALCKHNICTHLQLQVPEVVAGDGQQAYMQEDLQTPPDEGLSTQALNDKLRGLQGMHMHIQAVGQKSAAVNCMLPCM